MQKRSLSLALDRTCRLRRQLDRELRQPAVRRARLLQLQALVLLAQRRLAEIVTGAKFGPTPVPAYVISRRPTPNRSR